MGDLVKTAMDILSGISEVLIWLDRDEVEETLEILSAARAGGRKVLLVGAGRSGLVGKAFAMRLMHLGFEVYAMGETITPSIGEGDLIMVISGSGSTTLPVAVAEMSSRLGVKVLAITSHRESPLGRTADHVMVIPGRVKRVVEEEYLSRQLMGEHEPLAPMGTLFEDSCMIFLDAVITELMHRLEISEEEMKQKHAVIE